MSVKINCQHCGKVAFDYSPEPLEEPKIKVGMKFKGGGHDTKMIAKVTKIIEHDYFQCLYTDGCWGWEYAYNVRFLKR